MDRLPKKFHGSLGDLAQLIERTGIEGEWLGLLNGHWQFHTDTGAVLNFWTSTLTVSLQGNAVAARALERALLGVTAANSRERAVDVGKSNASRGALRYVRGHNAG